MQIYRARFGHDISEECRQLVAMAQHGPAQMDFNGITITADKDSDPAALAKFYVDESRRRHEAYIASDEYKQRMVEAAAAEAKRKAASVAALADAEARGITALTLSDPESWQKTADANSEGYGAAVIRYAETWGRLMEARVLAGQTIADCAEETSHIADTEGITGAMYGFAASMLSQWWIHGDDLKTWRASKGICY